MRGHMTADPPVRRRSTTRRRLQLIARPRPGAPATTAGGSASPPAGLVLGRDDADARHRLRARVAPPRARGPSPADDGCTLTDLGSKNGTHLNGERIAGRHGRCARATRIRIGAEKLHYVTGSATQTASRAARGAAPRRAAPRRRPGLTIGRDAAADVVLDDPNVSRLHAVHRVPRGRLCAHGPRLDERHLPSTASRVSGTLGSARGRDPDRPVSPPARPRLALSARDERGQMRLDARAVAERVKAKRRSCGRRTLRSQPGRFVAIIGESGAGKSTLMKVPWRVSNPLGGNRLDQRRGSSPLAPFEHRLRAAAGDHARPAHRASRRSRMARGCASRRTLPRPTSDDALRAGASTSCRPDRARPHARRPRCRAGSAAVPVSRCELLSRPSLVFLDEPTTGLDPGLEARMMSMLRDLAGGARSVVLVTHATASLELCDEVIVMGRGGVLVFQGSPAAALEFFGARALRADLRPPRGGTRDAVACDARGGGAAAARAPAERAPAGAGERPPPRPFGDQVDVLAGRYARLFARDRRNALILIGAGADHRAARRRALSARRLRRDGGARRTPRSCCSCS